MNYLFKRDKTFFIINTTFWLVLSLFTFIKAGYFLHLNGKEVFWAHIFSYTFTSGILWIVFSFVIWRLALVLKLKKERLLKIILLHIALAITISALQRFFSMSLDYFIQTQIIQINGFPSYTEYFGGHFPRRWTEGVLWYFLIATAVYCYIHIRKPANNEVAQSKEKYLPIKKKGTTQLVPYEEILFIKSESNYSIVHTNTEVFKIRSSLKSLEQSLAETPIMRVHNSYLVNSTKVLGFKHVQNGEYLFSLKETDKRITSTKSYKKEARQIIDLVESKF